MYESDLTRSLIVYLTHMITMFIPASGILLSWARGLFQALLVMALHGVSETPYKDVMVWAFYGMLGAVFIIRVARLSLQAKT